MLIWTITTAFSGVFQPLVWLDNASGSVTEKRLVSTLLALSIAGMAGNVRGVLCLDIVVIILFYLLRAFFGRGVGRDEANFASGGFHPGVLYGSDSILENSVTIDCLTWNNA